MEENERHDPRLSWIIRASFFSTFRVEFLLLTGFLPPHYAQRERYTRCRVEVKTHTFTFSARLLREPQDRRHNQRRQHSAKVFLFSPMAVVKAWPSLWHCCRVGLRVFRREAVGFYRALLSSQPSSCVMMEREELH